LPAATSTETSGWRWHREDTHLGLTRSRIVHRSDGAALGTGVNAMRLNRKTQPLVYTRVAIRTEILTEQKRRVELMRFISQLCFAFAGLIFVAAAIG